MDWRKHPAAGGSPSGPKKPATFRIAGENSGATCSRCRATRTDDELDAEFARRQRDGTLPPKRCRTFPGSPPQADPGTTRAARRRAALRHLPGRALTQDNNAARAGLIEVNAGPALGRRLDEHQYAVRLPRPDAAAARGTAAAPPGCPPSAAALQCRDPLFGAAGASTRTAP